MRTKLSKKTTTKSRSPQLRFSPTAWAKLLFLRDLGDTEVGGFGVSSEEDLLLVGDVQLVQQTCNYAHVEFDDEAVADYFDQQVDAGLRPEQFGRIWIHTHPGDCPLPSSTDEETFDRVFGRADWAVMFILAKGGQSYARLRFNHGPHVDVETSAVVEYSLPFSATDFERWQSEYDTYVIVREETILEIDRVLPQRSDPYEEFPNRQWYADWYEYTQDDEEELLL